MATVSDETLQDEGLERLVTGLWPNQRAFLKAFGECGKVTESARIAGINRVTVYFWARESPQFKAAFEAYEQIAARNLEDEAYRRAHDGVRRPVLYQGKQVYVKNEAGEEVPLWEHEYSDSMMSLLLKGLKPDKYREKWEGNLNMKGDHSPQVVVNLQQIVMESLKEFPEAKTAVARRLLEIDKAQSDQEKPKTNGHAADLTDERTD